MKHSTDKPCVKCPFRRGTVMLLNKSRIREIHNSIARHNGRDFDCHETLDYNADDAPRRTSKTKQCAGALIYVDKQGCSSQMTRIAERLGMLDMRKLSEHADEVWDDLDEWIENGSLPESNRRKKS